MSMPALTQDFLPRGDLSSYAHALCEEQDVDAESSYSLEAHIQQTQDTPASASSVTSPHEHTVNRSQDNTAIIPNAKTFVRQSAPQELVRTSSQTSARGVKADVVLQSVVHCGGGLLKGKVELCWSAKAKHNQQTQVTAIKLDCLGVESTKASASKMFLSLALDLVATGIYLNDLSNVFPQDFQVKPGNCSVPFEMQLPLDVGPGSFETTGAQIQYSFVCTVQVANEKRFADGKTMRIVRPIKLYPCLNPTKALIPTPAPIDASEEGKLRFGGKETLKIAARIHRPSWIAGQTAFVEVHITNDSKRKVNKIQLDLVRHLSFFKNSAATAGFQSVDCRVPERTLTKTISSNATSIKSDKSNNAYWKGVKHGGRDTIQCQIHVPADELSIQAGRFFETRYFIHVSVVTSGGGISVELPITIVHINSLDVLPSEAKSVANMVQIYADADGVHDATGSPTSSLSSGTRRHSVPSIMGEITRQGNTSALVTVLGDKDHNSVDNAARLAATKPGIQCDLRRALSLDYQSKFSKLDISAEQASYTRGVPLAERSPARARRDTKTNLADHLARTKNTNMSFNDII
ncbi:hypothetical protein BCR37DRAFT_37436 [Protomyces lactucae-debilis]|uniref:Arrestin C-terminal-like domain-containing protein n=1 Tax=Protomyces lactucae-debilis TaxID=2754530 RepID=A0A1Y2FEW1_PROLT|nr:uncharacterized protein BCR37DRAFT_37436 [Protomyces lactucae-debilis]ORY82147.1 hypothetical protein BCR37DRAFT_37436 [Protomyces lactucae-debilis]